MNMSLSSTRRVNACLRPSVSLKPVQKNMKRFSGPNMRQDKSPERRPEPVRTENALTVICHRRDRLAVQFVIELVAVTTGVSSDQIRTFSRNHARVARARQIAMYLTNIGWQWPLVRVGKAFDRDRTTVGHACRLIEDLRDDPLFDEMLERLEAALMSVPKTVDAMPSGADWFERTL